MDVAPRRQRGPGPATASSAAEALGGPTVEGGPAGPGAQVLAHARFEQIAESDPARPALLAAGEELTYGELNARAESLAASLRARGVGADSVVGIMLPRRAEAVVAVLAVLKAGGGYLPLDPSLPGERKRFMLADSRAATLIASPVLAADLASDALTVIPPDGHQPAPGTDRPAPALGDLAYLMYTSGSTGVPKGVMIEHRSLAAFVDWGLATFSSDELSSVLASTSFSFDISVFELLVTLSSGGRIVLVDNLLGLPEVAAGGVTLVNTVPSLIAALLNDHELPDSVETVILAGEPLSQDLAERVHDQPGVRRLVNGYGPTEDTIYSTFSEVQPGEPPSIGRPLPGTDAYVLDAAGRVAGPDGVGELHLAGIGLARGYWGREELTRERFIANPLPGRSGERLYRTGDLVRVQPDGTLHHLGRVDHQIKLRGVRIEPAEIEAALLGDSGVRQAVVVVHTRGSGERQLVAYYVPEPGAEPNAYVLKERLRRSLPAAMVPATYIALPEMPLNPNGKLDRDRLPDPPTVVSGGSAPETETQHALAELWRELLELDRPPAPTDDFFELGGQSLMAYKLVADIEGRLGVTLTPAVLVEASTLAALAARIDAGTGDAERVISVHANGERVPCVFIHGVAAGLLPLRRLGPALGHQQPLFGIQAFARAQREHGQLPTVEQAAAECLALLGELQPSGPYAMLGHSVGGHVVFEMATQLQAAGEEVAFLGLLDPSAPHTLLWRGRLIARGRELSGRGPARRRNRFVRAGFSAAMVAAGLRAPGEVGGDIIEREWVQALAVRERGYKPRPFRGDVVVYHTEQSVRFTGTRTLGWERHVDGGLETVPVPGDHVTMLADPHLDVLAADLDRRLNALQRASH